MVNHFLSKQAHQHHHTKLQLEEMGRQLIGGIPIDHAEHESLQQKHEEANEMEHRFLCAFGHTFEAEPVPGNTHIRLFCNTVILPGGETVRPDIINDVRMELPLAICRKHGADIIAQAVTHDWAEHDEHGNKLEVDDGK